jgi:hypothetical protein
MGKDDILKAVKEYEKKCGKEGRYENGYTYLMNDVTIYDGRNMTAHLGSGLHIVDGCFILFFGEWRDGNFVEEKRFYLEPSKTVVSTSAEPDSSEPRYVNLKKVME